MENENKTDASAKEIQPAESDFADEAKKSEPAVPEKAPEQPLEEKSVEEKPKEEPKQPEPSSYTYDDANLQSIETARQAFLKSYKKENMKRWIVSIAVLAIIIAAWIIPTLIEAMASYSLYVTLSVVAVAIVALGIYSYFMRKKLDEGVKGYFKEFYNLTSAYVFGEGVSDVSGSVDDKIAEADFTKCGLYKDIFKVGSRASIAFSYHGMKCGIADCAAQTKGHKALETSFVGKFLHADNNYDGPTIDLYFKGNDRALPPTAVKDLGVIEDDKVMAVYGPEEAKKLLTLKFRSLLKKIQTNRILVDVAISIQPGETFFCIGYEDDLMVLPLQKPFNPAPTQRYKADLALFLEIAEHLNTLKKD